MRRAAAIATLVAAVAASSSTYAAAESPRLPAAVRYDSGVVSGGGGKTARPVGSPRMMKKTICSNPLDPQMVMRSLPVMCIDFELAGGDTCARDLEIGLRLNTSSSAYILKQPLDIASEHTCASSADVAQHAPILQTVCGNQVEVCVGFYNTNGQNSLKLDKDSAAGCPAITLHNCRRTPLDPSDVHLVAMDCFTLGNDCSQYSECGDCLGNGCGWCTAGYSSEHACKAGSSSAGPSCAICGNATCGCDWNYETCPISAAVLQKADDALNKTITDINRTLYAYDVLKAKIASGVTITPPNKTDEYHCVVTKQLKKEHSASVVLTTILSLAMIFIGGIAGVTVGKAGYWDLVFRRGGDSEAGPMLSPSNDM